MRSGRMMVGVAGLVLLVGGMVWAVTGLRAFGGPITKYGRTVAHRSVPQRAATNSVVVTAFDYRGFDTLGEEYILFVSVVGVVVLLRAVRGEREPRAMPSEPGRGSEATRRLGSALLGAIAVLGAYVVVHGQLTPGGGFQGGVVIAAALAAMFVGGESLVLVRMRRGSGWAEMADAAGAAGFAMIGFAGLLITGIFFENFIDKGQSGLLTGGYIPLANISVGIEVAGALLVVLAELFDWRLLSPQR